MNEEANQRCLSCSMSNPAVAVEQRHGWLVPPAWELENENLKLKLELRRQEQQSTPDNEEG